MHPGSSPPRAQGVDHYENFPVASLLCPPRLRPAIAAIYWFARTADDIADEGNAPPEVRLQELTAYRTALAACVSTAQGPSTSAPPTAPAARWPEVFERLQPVSVQFGLPIPLLTDLLSAFEQDVVKQRYASQAELLDYCRRSANPVGRLLLHLYGVADAASLRQSDCICSALQLINFWQDLSVDIPRGRLYVPAEVQAQHGVTEQQLMAQEITPTTQALVADCVHTARALMREGAPLVKKIPGRGGWELRLVVQGGLRILDKIEAMQFRTLRERPRLRAWDVLVMGWRALWM